MKKLETQGRDQSRFLRWQDINWDRNRMTITSPKTKHSGKESRQTPLFPELRPLLAEGLELAEDGADFIITRYRDASQNLRTTFEKIIKRAGCNPGRSCFRICAPVVKRNWWKPIRCMS